MTQEYMLQEVAPRLRAGLGSSMPRSGGEDDAELLQDGLVIALGLLRGAQTKSKTVTPGNIAYYSIKHLRAGRRSTGFRKNDPLHPAAQLNGCRVYSLDEPVPTENGEDLTLSEGLDSRAEDPSVEAGRRLDWQGLLHRLDDVAKAILRALADGSELTRLGSPLELSRSSLQTRKNQLAKLIRDCLGEDRTRPRRWRPVTTATVCRNGLPGANCGFNAPTGCSGWWIIIGPGWRSWKSATKAVARRSSPPTKPIPPKPITTGGPGREPGAIPGFITRNSPVTAAGIPAPRPAHS
jgi:hypothetical protein